nr:uncharacterized mitochondrial protein AtMg00810-like [Tanacetum cinerariifolium]
STNKDLCKAFEKLMKDKFQMSSMGELILFLGLQVKQKPRWDIFVSRDKYVAKILRKFGLTDGKSASTPIDTKNPLLKDPDGDDVDVHTYISMIGSLMYLTSSRPDIMFAVCACARFQVTPKASHFHAVKRIFRYLKGKPHLGLWYPKDSPFNLVAYLDSDYAGASLDRKSTTGGCQFLGCRLISWQCKKQTVVATSSTKADLVRNVDSSTKFYTYLRFLQLMIRAPVGDLSSHTTKYSFPTVTQKVFSNMRMVEKRFSGVETPLFEGMIVAQQDDDVPDEGVASVDLDVVPTAVEPSIPSPTPTTQPPPPSQELPSTSQVIPTQPPSPIAEPSSPPQQQQPSQPTHDAEISLDLLHTLMETCTTLTRKVEDLEQDKVAQALEIIKLKQMVKKLERKNKLRVSGLMRLKKGEIIAHMDADEDVTLKDVDVVSKEVEVEKDAKIEENADVQWRLEESQAQIYKIDLEHADKVLSMQDDELEPAELKEVVEVVTTVKLMTEVVTVASATITAATTPITAAPKQLEEKARRALKRASESQAEKAAKKQKLNQEVEELKKHIQVVPNDEDDVYTEAAPLGRKVPVVDYEIYTENNKPYYKIIRADGSSQLFLSFLSLLRNFDRKDLEVLWQLVKERFAYSEPKNFSDDFLLTTLTYMFKKPDVQAQVWKNQMRVHGLAKVKIWRLLESCGVHIITFTTTHMILLVEIRYPLTMFTLDQMLNNVRLEVEEESEVSLELLRFMRQ